MILVNGQPYTGTAATVEELLCELRFDPTRVAVEKNGGIVRRTEFSDTAISDGDRIEIVHFVGGG